jgi:glycosyltransferase involved in cell wall biosynthesis
MPSSMSRPLVSVMMPCFNSEATLSLAIASLVAQTLQDWECVCVDDGSTDGTWEILQRARGLDDRFRIERFPENRGRGAARQRVLELITGEYLAFLDSDDWMFPDRLRHERDWLALDPNIAAVSVCAAVTRGSELIGLIRPRTTKPLPVVTIFDAPVPPAILFPTSMIRADIARNTGFDPAFRRSQDGDFLVRALLGRHYALSSAVLYAYSASATTPATTLEGYRYRMKSHARHWRHHPARVARTLLETTSKIATYRAAGMFGLDHKLVARRWGVFDEDTQRQFDRAFASVRDVQRRLFD